jgi:hypothetical protein
MSSRERRRIYALGRSLLLAPVLMGLGCDLLPLHNDQCTYAGRRHDQGDTFPSADGCNTCSCSSGGSIACTKRACLPPDAGTSDAATGCTFGDRTYAVGETFGAGCNSCTCTASGQVACTTIACPVDAGANDCVFDRTYRFHDDGGFVAFTDSSTLSPPRTHLMTRDHFRNSLPNQCTRALVCSDSTLVDVKEIQQALAHPDVVAALAQTTRPFYGTDTRPVDGTVFMFDRDDGRGFDVGSGTVPAGLRALVDLLHQLQTQTAATPECAGL